MQPTLLVSAVRDPVQAQYVAIAGLDPVSLGRVAVVANELNLWRKGREGREGWSEGGREIHESTPTV